MSHINRRHLLQGAAALGAVGGGHAYADDATPSATAVKSDLTASKPMTTYIGAATPRVDGRAKVTGEARYAGEFKASGLVHASVVTSSIPKGRIARIDTTRHCGSQACSTCSPTTTGPAWPTTTRRGRTKSRRRMAPRSVRSLTTGSCSAASRSPWCWRRIGKPPATRPRWLISSMRSRPSPPTSTSSAIRPLWSRSPRSRVATPTRPMPRPTSATRQNISSRPSITTRWSCLPPPWHGTAAAS